MRAWRIAALVLVFAGIIGGSWIFIFSGEKTARLETASGRQFKGFSLPDRKGQTNRIEPGREFLILHFWATWCPPCLGEIKEITETAKKMADQPVRWVFVSAADKWEDAQKYLPDSTLSSKILSVMDTDLKTVESFGTFQYPETYFYAPDGRLIQKWVGAQNWAQLDLKGRFKTP